ncbi:MAG: DUF4276 family protein [Candidatus Electrothrix sp. EH2]|nr:DUF4276 family protein [Candidatus Electrothrix sp. EH2]
MKEIRCTLLTDGSSDRALLPILSWLLYEHCPEYAVQPEWADLSRLPAKPKKLSERIRYSVDLYPCDLLFVHRDTEKMSWETRAEEIRQALNGMEHPPAVCVIPVRMHEAWLLHDEQAIRKAAGNPNGEEPLELPVANRVEALPNPKKNLHDALLAASGKSGKRRKKMLNVNKLACRITELTESFAALRSLSAFRNFEDDLLKVLREQQWNI